MVKRIDTSTFGISTGDERHWNLDDGAFDEVAFSSGIVLTTENREKIREALRICLVDASLSKRLGNPQRFYKLANAFDKSARHFISEVEKLRSEYYVALTLALLQEQITFDDLHAMEVRVRLLQHSVKTASKKLKAKETGGAGRSDRIWLNGLVTALAKVFGDAGGKVAAAYSENAERPDGDFGMRDGPFVRFVEWHLNRLPPELHIRQPALGEAINRALKPSAKRSRLAG